MKHSIDTPSLAKAHTLLRKLALAAGLLGACLTAQADLADVKARGYLAVATEDDYAPFNFIVDGKPEGFHKDLLEDFKAFAGKSGFDVRQEILPWTGLLASVASGQYDMGYTGALVTDDRLRVFNFAPPFASAQHYYVKRKGDDSIGDIASLSGKTVGLQAGSALLARLPELKKMLEAGGGKLGKVVEYPSYPEIYADLANGRLDYVVNSVTSVNDLVKAKPEVFAKGLPVSGNGFAAWPVPKNSPELLKLLTTFMQEVHASGRLAELQQKWFGESFDDLPLEPITSVKQFHELANIE
ncbi:transporter substrate-binding domain-containing protein [Stutzerimonas kirkiae]|uniref:Amino acid ABC transporter substrate-binding protein n=1 Tax=Stutzerimonas kirkiae TaxID=2211392 RepID=A0A4Q9R189_9GAMM|nr:transporter substrate-binding domain-containing protein [Stutzerimonas kirkiae]TBU90645.1 amino acid ABC transporter substrate-binding protein [Stutzerimonas kirkiae]TBV00157.1 amino acid ABC transporter substrate-binding protein [Stutzerimonas kirkiae]TBV04770.1 amino acid ABC transporter substrate-binding protein [Stutzerimonas kirkiae]TBV14064.1 amino acid ABC transporter substrate-binding protein [Stutzerimonas kirkiae]